MSADKDTRPTSFPQNIVFCHAMLEGVFQSLAEKDQRISQLEELVTTLIRAVQPRKRTLRSRSARALPIRGRRRRSGRRTAGRRGEHSETTTTRRASSSRSERSSCGAAPPFARRPEELPQVWCRPNHLAGQGQALLGLSTGGDFWHSAYAREGLLQLLP